VPSGRAGPAMSRLGLNIRTGSRLGRRNVNQDRVFFSGRMVAVADGVGGGERGDVAAQVALGSVMLDSAAWGDAESPAATGAALVGLAAGAHARVVEVGRRYGACESTLSMVHVAPAPTGEGSARAGSVASVVWVGDSPVFLSVAGTTRQVTTPHAQQSPTGRTSLTRALGARSAIPQSQQLLLEGAARIVVATDGLLAVPAPLLLRLIGDIDASAAHCLERLLEAADQSGARDNVSIGVVDIVEAHDDDTSSWTSALGAPVAGRQLLGPG